MALVVAVLAALAVLAAEIALVLPALVVASREQPVAADGVPDSEVTLVTLTARNWSPRPVEQPRYAAIAVKQATHFCPMGRRS
ncbi:hypothetical protein [Sorangium sp. So ce362]|uniref:hypothetical protein n=1 Tax=Sorangium sp. So ce362 TaxID=3133303 RepID=UPI003F60EB16